MSSNVLSLQNVEKWLPEAGFSKSAGFVARLFSAIHRAMGSLVAVPQSPKKESQQKARNELERFFLWGQGFSVMDGDLDEVLAHSRELREQVLTLLLRLGTAVLRSLMRDSGDSIRVVSDQFDDLRTLLNAAETMLQDTDSRSESDDLDTFSESDTSDCSTMEILDEISIYVDCLLDLSSVLDKPAFDVQLEGSGKDAAAQRQERFVVSSDEALIYCRRIRDRFTDLPKYLVERLAEANVLRAASLRSLRTFNSWPHSAKQGRLVADDIAESLFSNTDPQVQTETTKSSVPLSSIFSSSAKHRPSLPQVPDDISDNETFATFSTAASAVAQGRVRVPSMPEIRGEGFNCPICSAHITTVKNRKDWKRHVFNDLMPYVCTAETCDGAPRLYIRSLAWAMHEAAHDETCPSQAHCAFCGAEYQTKENAYYKHISKHLREISLAILSQAIDEDGGDNDDGSEDDYRSDMDSQPDDIPGRAVVEGENSASYISDVDNARLGAIGQRLPREGATSPPESSTTEPGDPSYSSFMSKVGAGIDIDDDETKSAAVGKGSYDESDLAELEETSISAPGEATVPTTNDDEVDLDSIIDRLLEVRGSPPGKQVRLLEPEIRWLCIKAREIFISQSILLELIPPLNVCGSIHGQYQDLLRVFEYGGFPPEADYLFLGNYVDIGDQSLETICLLFAYKIKYPENFFILRGNHEIASVNRIYGFYDEIKSRHDIKLWENFTDAFCCMPMAAIINEKVFCMNGGLSPDLKSMEQIRRIMRPTDVPEVGLPHDLLFADPEKDAKGWYESKNEHGVSFTFGPDIVSHFLQKHDLDLIVRSKQVVEDGYEFFAKRKLVTLFTATNFKGEYDNAGAMMSIDETLLVSFQILMPRTQRGTRDIT